MPTRAFIITCNSCGKSCMPRLLNLVSLWQVIRAVCVYERSCSALGSAIGGFCFREHSRLYKLTPRCGEFQFKFVPRFRSVYQYSTSSHHVQLLQIMAADQADSHTVTIVISSDSGEDPDELNSGEPELISSDSEEHQEELRLAASMYKLWYNAYIHD